jgi:cyclophilin family peptidyl-prolyl cis-trans isomerase
MKRLLALLSLATLTLIAGCGEERAAAKNPVVVVETSMGKIKIELFADKAPGTVKNFLRYVDDKFYDGTVFHRVIEDFMIQGGGFETGMQDVQSAREFKAKEKKTRGPIKNEASNGLSNVRGTVAMARTPDPDSATAQFFISVANNSQGLDPAPGEAGYCVFGKVIDGMDVVDKIRKVSTHAIIPREIENVPDKDVVIKSVRRAED